MSIGIAMPQFKFQGDQQVFIAENRHPVTIKGRTEFFTGKQPRYYVVSEDVIPGKNIGEDWINEDKLTDVLPEIKEEAVAESDPRLATEKKKKGVRTHGL